MKPLLPLSLAIGIALTAGAACAQQVAPLAPPAAAPRANANADPQPAGVTRAQGLVMVDYQVIPVPGDPSIDLLGFHFLNRMNDWLYLGVGGYAPLFKGEYGGFLALDVTAHVQRRLVGKLFANGGLSVGGGGGGKTVEQSKILSGTGGFAKAYLGLGYDLTDFSIGANVARIKFNKSAIDHSQLNVFLQVPFSYASAPYAKAGARLSRADAAALGGAADASESMLTIGLDNFVQIDARGLNKDTINVADLQFSHFITKDAYWFANAAVGYRGLPLYNQVLGGLGHRFALSPRTSLYAQLGVGSGGYAPETVDTGPGLLVYPRLAAEYVLDRNWGLALSAGYLFAPKGSSKNYSVAALLNYHIRSGGGAGAAGGAADGGFFRGYRINLFPQSDFGVNSRGIDRPRINMLTAQLDGLVNDHLYIPVQTSIATTAYLDKPGYGELLAGVGWQTKHAPDRRLQWFGQLLLGTNSHGPMLKTGVGLNFGLNDRLAVYGVVGQSFGVDKEKFRADYVGFGLTHRFSVPSW